MTSKIETPAVRLTNVAKTYDVDTSEVSALSGITLDIPRRRFVAVVGPSGSGKTTLLNLIGCIDTPTSGRIEISGQDVTDLSDDAIADFRAHKIAFIFQSFNLIPVLSAEENVEFPLLLLDIAQRERRERTAAMLEAVGLSGQRHRRPNQLSGGQKQRVAIARALVKRPEIVLADEPTANLDSHTGAGIIDLMRKVHEDLASTFVISTHDSQLMAQAEETLYIRDGELVDRHPKTAV